MNTAIDAYLALSRQQRDSVRTTVRSLAVHAGEHYADLLAADAGAAAREVFPQLARLVFSLGEDVLGPSASLVAAYDPAGRLLWHVAHDDEWPDESDVTDKLTAAYEWRPDNRVPFRQAGEDPDMYEYLPPTPPASAARATDPHQGSQP
jgi:hypothetical protein